MVQNQGGSASSQVDQNQAKDNTSDHYASVYHLEGSYSQNTFQYLFSFSFECAILVLISASAALSVSDIPWNGPVGMSTFDLPVGYTSCVVDK